MRIEHSQEPANELGSTEFNLQTTSTSVKFGTPRTPISDQYPAIAPGTYVVQTGDTFQTIAQAVYGDASLWYVIADANSTLDGTTLTAGTVLKLPNNVIDARNNVTTYKPYNPSQIIGDQTPPLPAPPKANSSFIATAIIAVVVIVATVLSAGGAAGVLGAAGSTFGTSTAAVGASALAGGAGLTAGASGFALVTATATGIAAAAVGGAAGSIAGQLTGDALGVSHGLSLTQVAEGAFAAGATAGIASELGVAAQTGTLTATQVGERAASGFAEGAFNSIARQGIGIALGTQKSFSFSQVAANALVSGAFAGAGATNPQINQFAGIQAQPITIGGVLGQTAENFGSGIATQEIAVALAGHGKIDVADIAADSFGNALGNSIVGQIESTPGETQQQTQQQNSSGSPAYNIPALGGDIGSPFAPLPTIPSYADTSGAPPASTSIAGTNTGGGSTAAVAQDATATALTLNALNGAGTGQSVFTGQGTQVADSGQVFSDASYGGSPDNAEQLPEVVVTAKSPGFFSQLESGAEQALSGVGSFLTAFGKYAVGTTELALSGVYNEGVRIVGGLASIPVAAFDSVDDAVALQHSIKNTIGYTPQTEGALAIESALQPVGQFVDQNVLTPLHNISEAYLGDGLTTLLSGTAQFVAESAGVAGGIGAARGIAETLLTTSATDSVAPLAHIFEGHPSGRGFSGVFDTSDGSIGISPSTYDLPVPDGYVAARGGHFDVSQELGGDPGNHLGFATVLQDDGSLNITFLSRTLNQTPGNLVPVGIRPQIIEALQQQTGRVVRQGP